MSDTQLIKDKIDVVDLIQEYVQLKPAGINHKGLCPFHTEKSPSFMANRERQNWHCFGCSKGGDIFTFIQDIEGMDFVEALKYLANRAGVQLTNTMQNQAQSSQKNRIKDINTEAARFYYNFLTQMVGSKPAMEYLTGRGLVRDTIDEWQIGFVPDQWDLLTKYLLKKGHGIDDLVASGLTIKRDGADSQSGRGFYDRFRGRIMFPIRNVHGAVIGFTGRVLVETEKSGGKYVNTPQTLVYDKSRVVFGLGKAKKEIRKKDLAVMVEGQMDVIAAHQAGMTNVVATSGTAMTEKQVELLKRYSANISMAFDSDEAGVKAAKRGISIAVAQGMNVKVIKIPDGAGKDPDECIQKDTSVWFAAVEGAQHVMNWYFDKAFFGKNIHDPRQKQQIADELLAEVGLIPYAVEQDHWLRELAGRIGVDVQVLRGDMDRVKKNTKPRSTVRGQQSVESDSSGVPAAAPLRTKTRLDALLESLLSLVLVCPDVFESVKKDLSEVDLSTTVHGFLYEKMITQYNDRGSLDTEQLRKVANVDESGENIVDILLMKGGLDFSDISKDAAKKESAHIASQLRDVWVKQRRKEIEIGIEKAERDGDSQAVEDLLKQLHTIE